MNDFTEAAHSYEARGWRVLPLHRVGPDGVTCSCRKGRTCTSKGKHPIDNEWQKAVRMSAADIEATWDVDCPPNIGIATGAESGTWVLDIDPSGGGFATMGALKAEHGELPATTVAQTGSGGYHYFFATDPGLRNSQGRVGPGIDVRADGGQVVAAPSWTGKGVYTLIADLPIAPAPEWLLELARKEAHDIAPVTAEDLPKPEDLDEHTWKRLTKYAQRAIDSELERLDKMRTAATSNASDYRGEPWNLTTFEVSCTLLEFANSPWCAYSIGQARRDVLDHSPRDTAFDEHTIVKTFNSAREKVGPKARPMPEDRTPPTPAGLDPMFTGPDVKGNPNPSGGDGDNAEPVAQQRWQFFGGEKGTTPIYTNMAAAVRAVGPVGWGIDSDFWRYESGRWSPDGYLVKHRLIDALGAAYKTSHYGSTADIAQRHAEKLTADPLESMMNFRNGMLEWRTGELGEHDPNLGSTVQFGCEWDPGATCESFDAWIEDILHPDYVALAWEMIGYLMMSGNPMQTAFLFYGSGSNGKGTLLNLLEMLLGQENIASESLDDLNGNRFRSANLLGKIANLAGDIDATYQEHTAMFKSITGEDMITGERKGKDPFRFESWAVPVFSANKFPGSADVTDGYLRRWIVLQFHKKISADSAVNRKSLMRAFGLELPGIAAKGVQNLRILIDRGHFAPQGEALKAKEEFAMSIDQVRRWFADGAPTVAPEISTNLEKLYANYRIWADASGQSKVGQVEFSHRVEAIGYPVTKIGGETYHTGISVPDINHHAVTPATYFN